MEWTWARIDELVNNREEESLKLDFKAAGALAKSQGKKDEVSKDISAMANSAGGTVIYGVAEDSDCAADHLDLVDSGQFSKEWLEQVIDGVQPPIKGVIVHRLRKSEGDSDVVYVVEVPQSDTAHQARDKRYHRRQDTHTVQMMDHEIRDVMGRAKHPSVVLEFWIPQDIEDGDDDEIPIVVFARNDGYVLAQHISGVVTMSLFLASPDELRNQSGKGNVSPVAALRVTNHTGDYPEPLLPGTSRQVGKLGLSRQWNVQLRNGVKPEVEWVMYSDNAPSRSGRVLIKDIERDGSKLQLLRPSEP